VNGLEPEKNLLGRRLLKSWASNGLAAELTKELGWAASHELKKTP